MSSIEERRAGMIKTESGGYRGTLESANRQRTEQLKHSNLPKIRYFTLEEQQNFIHNHPVSYLDEGNPLERVQRRFSEEFHTPLFMPYTSSYNKKWTYQQLEALAMQGVSVSMKYEDSEGRPANPATGFPVFPYAYNLKGSDREGRGYYERFLTTELPDSRIYSGTPTISGTSPVSEKVKASGMHKIISRASKKPVRVFQPTITDSAPITIPSIPEVYAEPEPVEVWPTLSQETKTIINNIPSKIKAPNWFVNNNINWLLEGKISETEFLAGYYDYVKKGTIILIDEPEPIVDQVSTNMIRQELISFTIINNRIQGSIKFTATDAFNPYFYNKPITNYLQLKSEGFPIESPTNPKSNRLTFTETARDEIITFDEDAQNLTFVNAESFIEPGMAEVLTFTIEAGKEATTTKTGFMGAGVLGLIGILMLGGFIADHARRKR